MSSTVRMALFDSDGVLTDGGVYLDEAGRQTRRFDIKDGAGLVHLRERGVIVGVVSASPVEAVGVRMAALGGEEIHLGVKDKVGCIDAILARRSFSWSEVAYMGDDLADLGVLERAGFSAAPRDAVGAVLQMVRWTSRYDGGHGAVREWCDYLRSILERKSASC
ncbi:MAG: KdsC family phosphatase [Puniceicoccaceae bacterium]